MRHKGPREEKSLVRVAATFARILRTRRIRRAFCFPATTVYIAPPARKCKSPMTPMHSALASFPRGLLEQFPEMPLTEVCPSSIPTVTQSPVFRFQTFPCSTFHLFSPRISRRDRLARLHTCNAGIAKMVPFEHAFLSRLTFRL